MKKVTKIDAVRAPEEQTKQLRVAAYCRVSTDSDAQMESLAAQKRHYITYIARRGDWEFAGLYFDEGISGTKKDSRPELLRLIADCEAGKIDLIITKSISRLARNITDCLGMVRRLLELNIPIYFEKENLNTGAMESELFLSILSGMAEGESLSISRNVKWSVQKRFENGTYKISSPPYGFAWDGEDLTVVPEQAETVRWIFAQALAGEGAQAIADELNAQGIPSKKGGKWSAATIYGMLANEQYTGCVVFQKTFTDESFNRHHNRGEMGRYAHTEHHAAIVSKADFEAVRALIRQRASEKGVVSDTGKYLQRYCFTGRIICGDCGGTFKRRIHSSAGHRYVAWCCRAHISDKASCSMKYVEDDKLKAAFITMMNKLIYGQRVILKPYVDALRSEKKDTSFSRIQQLQTMLLQNSDQRDTLARLMGQDDIDQILYNEENNALLRKADEYKAEIERLNKSISGEGAYLREAIALLRFTGKSGMLTAFDDELFTQTVEKIVIESRNVFVFRLKCGLSLKERM